MSQINTFALETKARLVARSLKLKGTSISVSNWMDDHQGRPGAVKVGPFVGDVD